MTGGPNLTVIRDHAVGKTLWSLLDNAASQLRALGAEPVVVASCPWKFNDAWNDTDWRGIQVGAFACERTEYFARPEDYDKNLREGPDEARTADAVLSRLEAGGWRDLYQRTFAREAMPTEEVIALVLQDDEAWLVVNGSNSGASAVYRLAAGYLDHVGRCLDDALRFDQRLGQDRPLVIRSRADDEAERATLLSRLDALEAEPENGRPDWYDRRGRKWALHSWHAGPLLRRLEKLAVTGRISIEEYESLGRLISLYGES